MEDCKLCAKLNNTLKGDESTKRDDDEQGDGESGGGEADDWMTTTPHDESIPYSHRYGYTWAGITSSGLGGLRPSACPGCS